MKRGFRRNFDALGEVFDFTREFFSGHSVNEEHRFAVDFAIEEIFTNMVKYQPQSAEEIQIELRRDGSRLRIEMIDVGAVPFDVTRVADAKTETSIDERRPGGLGIHLTRRFMDSMEYAHDNGTSRIVMIKELG